MTPPAATRAARRAAAPRRARRTEAPAPRVAPRIPRRVSGPVRRRAAAQPRPRRRPAEPLRLRLVAFAATLPDRGFVDRMVRGRAWIAVIGTLLIGLVAMQVSLLKLNAGIGNDVQRAAALERTNGELRAQVSQLESGERVQEAAAGLGMILPPAGQISYLRADGAAAAAGAAQALHDQRFNDVSKIQPLPGEGDSGASVDPITAAADTGTSSTDSSGSSSGTGSADSSSSSAGGDRTATTSTDSGGGSSASGGSGQ